MGHAASFGARLLRLGRSRRLRTIGVVVAAAFVIFNLAGFLGVPLLVRHLVRVQFAADLHRQVTVATIRFNPYTLRLKADDLRVSQRDGSPGFAAIGEIRFKAAWSSFYRFAPILQQLSIDGPVLHAVRLPDRRFNFSDLIESGPRSKPSSGRHLQFAVNNIRLGEGQVFFDDQAFHEQHRIEHIEVGVPFIANLPADVEIFVQPMVRMVIDGSPFRMVGITKPFASTRESILNLRLRNLDLTRVAAYLPRSMPLKLSNGALSTKVQVHFIQPQSGPVIVLSGTMEVDGLDVHDGSNAPLVSLKRAAVTLTHVEPLRQLVILGPVEVKGLVCALTRNQGSTTNLAPLAAAFAASKQAPRAPEQSSPPYLFVGSFDLSDSEINFNDKSGGAPAALTLSSMHVGLKNFATNKQAPPAPYEIGAHLGQGSITLSGSLDLAHSGATMRAALDKIDLPPLQTFAQPFWAGTLASGTLSAHAQLQADFTAGRFNARMQSSTASLQMIELRAPGEAQKPVQFKSLSVTINQMDLAARHAAIKEVRIDGLQMLARRDRDGVLSLTSFVRPHTAAPQSAATPASAWQYQIGSVALENATAGMEDDRASTPVVMEVAPLNLHLKEVSSDLSKPFELEVDGALKPSGKFKVDGTAAAAPPAAKLHVVTTGIDLAPADAYLASRLNAKITRAWLTSDGEIQLDRIANNFRVRYQGNAILGNVHTRDKLTNERFLRWAALNARQIRADIGGGPPRVDVGELGLADFYARVILNSDAKLNLNDIIARPHAGATSLTRTKPESAAGAQPSAPPAKPAQKTPPSTAMLGAQINVGHITLRDGHVNFSDHFIKPAYTADLTDITGEIGGFGTRSEEPAEVELQGEINSSAPINITGSINPLAPEALVDIKARAEGVELTNLTPYSTKYTGYPITRGTLNADVHYHLEHRELKATNHLFISQLTFGNKVKSPSAINLPLALAVSLLKNPRGEIDLKLPVSGSLNDPKFSIGSVILHALSNLILKVASSPFSVLASVAGASNAQRLEYVEFAPGLATLTPDSISRLSTLAKALKDRPALRLTITGRVDPGVDRDGLRAAMVDRQIKVQKAKALREHGEIVQVASVEVAPDEYDKYLKLAYQQATFNKPRNFLGLNKSLPTDEMKKLMLANTHVTDDDLKQLAGARATAVRKYLSKQINPVRLALGPPELNANGLKGPGETTRVDLSLE